MKALAILALLAASPGLAQSPSEAAQEAAQLLVEARGALESADHRSDRITVLSQTIRAYESGLAAMREGLRQAAIRQQSLEAALETKSEETARLLGALQTMGRAPAPMLMLHPYGPTGTARSGMMLVDLMPALQREVTALQEQIDELKLLRDLQANALDTLSNGLEEVEQARAALSLAIAERTDLPRRYIEDPNATAVLLASAETLEAFATGLADIPAGDGGTFTAMNRGAIRLPVEGRLVRRFNEADAAGVVRPGILIATRPRALVTATATATVRYAGDLLDFGNVIILEPSSETLWIIAGMADVFGKEGQILPEGTPIGMMGGEMPSAEAILTETSQGFAEQSSETLYLEVREGQTAVDPRNWFAID